MSEEQVTKAILKWLDQNKWKIICFDFPQSGTGKLLHPNNSFSEKNKKAINPDIIAVRQNICLYFENKDRVYLPDFNKIYLIKNGNDYSNAFSKLLHGHMINEMFFGIGLPASCYNKKANENKNLTDFIVGVNEDFSVDFLWRANSDILI